MRVATPTHEAKNKLQKLGLDLTEHGGHDFIEVVVYGKRDTDLLHKNGFTYTVQVKSLEEQSRADQRKDVRYAQTTQRSPLPSGRTGYRTYEQYLADIDLLARTYPGLVKKITLSQKTFEGRPIHGLEITNNVEARDGKPVFLQMGLHHAREWPSGEHAIEWAFELATNYGKDPRTTDLVNRVRTIVVPVVNPDGFILSRSSRPDDRGDPGTGSQRVDELAEIGRILGTPTFEFKRKNCNTTVSGQRVPCPSHRQLGVDLNRNYGAFWGGAGTSTADNSDVYHGKTPFSEPETQSIRDLVASRHVTTLITNHTFSNLVLRPPGVAAQGAPPDEFALEQLGADMTAHNGYANIPGHGLYDTTGTTEDWSYNATGGYGYTYEIGRARFHPVFEATVDEWTGAAARRRPGATGREGGNREAYYVAMRNAANTQHHSVVTGTGAPGNVLRVRKAFKTPTSLKNDDESVRTFDDKLDVTTTVPPSGNFQWSMNPSTRPLVAARPGRTPEGPASAPQNLTLVKPTIPCPGNEFVEQIKNETCIEDKEFVVPGRPDDNGYATVRIEWDDPQADWDLEVFHKRAGDGLLERVGGSLSGGTTSEQFTVFNPTPRGTPETYVARVINYSATPADAWRGRVTFTQPRPGDPGTTESWSLTCERPDGRVLGSRQLTIGRNQVSALGVPCGASGRANAPTGLDKVAPRARLLNPYIVSRTSKTRRFRVPWTGTDAGTGVSSYIVEVRELGKTKTPFRFVSASTTRRSTVFRGVIGRSYQFRLRAVDFAGNTSRATFKTTVVPIDEKARGVRYRGFKRAKSSKAYGGTVTGASRRGATMAYVYRGGTFYLVGIKNRFGGLAKVTIDGRRTRIIDTYSSRTKHRALLLRARLGTGRHRVVVRVLGRKRAASRGHNVRIDALGLYRRR